MPSKRPAASAKQSATKGGRGKSGTAAAGKKLPAPAVNKSTSKGASAQGKGKKTKTVAAAAAAAVAKQRTAPDRSAVTTCAYEMASTGSNPSCKMIQSKTELLFDGKKPRFRPATATATASTATATEENVEESKSVVRYDPQNFPKIYNVLGGQSGEGLCYRNGVIRMQGKPFRKRLREISDSWLLEMVKKLHHFSKGANGRKTVTLQDVLCASKTMGIDTLVV